MTLKGTLWLYKYAWWEIWYSFKMIYHNRRKQVYKHFRPKWVPLRLDVSEHANLNFFQDHGILIVFWNIQCSAAHFNLLSYSLLWFTFQLKDVLKNARLLKMALVYCTAKSHLRVITSFKNYVNKLKKAVIFYVVQQSLEALLESDKNKHYALYTNSTYFKSSISIKDLHQYTCRFSKKTFYRVLNVGFSLRF